MGENIIEAKGLTAGYGKSVIIEENNITIQKGKITSIVGPNGSGKSTLLKTLMGLTRLFSGQIFYNGVEITGLTPEERSMKGMGYVPQVANIFPNLTVVENLEIGAYMRRDREKVKDDMEEIMDIFKKKS